MSATTTVTFPIASLRIYPPQFAGGRLAVCREPTPGAELECYEIEPGVPITVMGRASNLIGIVSFVVATPDGVAVVTTDPHQYGRVVSVDFRTPS